jgi:hypothetical protein
MYVIHTRETRQTHLRVEGLTARVAVSAWPHTSPADAIKLHIVSEVQIVNWADVEATRMVGE